jgi:hypothetical protein
MADTQWSFVGAASPSRNRMISLEERAARGLAYGLLGFGGLAHYFTPHRHAISPRCAATIFGEAIASALLIAYVLLAGTTRAKAFEMGVASTTSPAK